MNPEFSLVTACCFWPPSAQRNVAIAAAASTTIDWMRFLNVVKRHRVTGLVWNGLSQAGIETPLSVAKTLEVGANNIARAGLSLCAEAIRLDRLIREAGCECAFVKGTTLAMLAYGNVGVRHAKDIDMIVPMADLLTVCALLKAAGYRQIRPTEAIDEAQFALWRTYGKDLEWRHDPKGIDLELHWRLTDLSSLLTAPPDFSALRTVAVASSASIMTLPAQELFIYLCVHGAVHGWNRLKWLADVNALLSDQAGAIESYYAAAVAQRAERAVGQALLLCAALFELPLPDRLSATLRASRVTTTLAKIGTISMLRGNAATEVYDLRFGTTLINLSHLLLARGFRAWIGEVVRKGIDLDDVLNLPLPKSLALLYWLMRGPAWLWRRTRMAGASYSLRQPPIRAKSRR